MLPELVRRGAVEKTRRVLADLLGVQYKCKPVDKSQVMGIMALMPVVQDVVCMQALSPLREFISQIYR